MPQEIGLFFFSFANNALIFQVLCFVTSLTVRKLLRIMEIPSFVQIPWCIIYKLSGK